MINCEKRFTVVRSGEPLLTSHESATTPRGRCPGGASRRERVGLSWTHEQTTKWRTTVGLLSGLLKAGIAKKVYDEARKPHNQAKAKEMFNQLRSKGKRPPPR